ncbi:upstream activation factor subunit spp27-like isoform X1 [Solanum stenotomum]|uniref:upstream activation factor subunit spp27-like isoform X1 n=1 Tax=Solanum stenotomum TaxID=172797 RepID=UPI0020D192DE|nr:upstream activation factor subunit spp27-like isoform X1 [Solanum stenotomum]
MVSDSVLVDRLREILRVSDLEIATAGTVRRRLEEELGVDLLDRKAFIRDQIDLFLRIQVEETPKNDVHEAENGKEGENDDSCSQEEQEEEQVKEDENGDSCSQEEELGEDKSATRSKKKARRSEKMNGEAKKKGGFNKPCALSPQLQKLVGEPELGRPEVVKKIWAYIREKNLQNPENKRKILCDEVLSGIFQVKSIDMFQMNKVLSKHIWPLNEENGTQVKTSVKRRLPKKGRVEALDEPKQKEKRQKGGGSGFLAPVQLSDALVKFLGIGENALPRADVIKRIWQYIKENKLQDPSDKKTIICDERLKELFQVDSFHGFTVTKLLTAHFIKKED